jgi:hypothetical protein
MVIIHQTLVVKSLDAVFLVCSIAVMDNAIMRDADDWLILQAHCGAGRPARRVLSSLRSGEGCHRDGMTWLATVSRSYTREAMHAAVLLRMIAGRA